jgi:hypothetical protein
MTAAPTYNNIYRKSDGGRARARAEKGRVGVRGGAGEVIVALVKSFFSLLYDILLVMMT